MLKKLRDFFKEDVWHLADKLKGLPKLGIRMVQVAFLTGRDYIEDKCAVRASALTFYSVLSLVPVLALLFGIAKGFGFEEKLKTRILESTDQNQELFMQMFTFAENTLHNARGGVLAGIGIILLLYTLVKTISLIEDTFNDIWNVKQARTILRKFTDYLSITLLAPILLVFSGSAMVFVSSNLEAVAHKMGIISVIGPVLKFSLNLSPYILVWLLFLAIYMIMPNRNVKFKSAMIAAIVAGSVYQGVSWVYVVFQVGVSKYNGIYGSFAALPLFLIWLQTSWTIVLLGAELSYVIQNIDELVLTFRKRKISPIQKLKFSIVVLRALLRHGPDSLPYRTSMQLSEETGIGPDRVEDILFELEKVNLVVEVERETEMYYQSARDSKELNVLYVIEGLLGKEDDLPSEEKDEIEEWFQLLKNDLKTSKGNAFLRE
ncbi:MAG: ribonuclease BN [Crocinitomicaceae bacterium]|nr:ribonuclease BN [Crocinitomicaceae bacterium]